MFAYSAKRGGVDFFPAADPQSTIDAFLLHVVQGKQYLAECMLKKDPDLILARCSAIDGSGRLIKHFSALEYAFWAMDTDMCEMLVKYLTSPEIRGENLTRIHEICYRGLRYTQHGKEVCESHFDFKPLISALQSYVENFKDRYFREMEKPPEERNWDELKAAWMNVGKEQRNLPAHVIHLYVDPSRPLDASIPYSTPVRRTLEYAFSTWRDILHTSPIEPWAYSALPDKSDVCYAFFPLKDGVGPGFDFALSDRGEKVAVDIITPPIAPSEGYDTKHPFRERFRRFDSGEIVVKPPCIRQLKEIQALYVQRQREQQELLSRLEQSAALDISGDRDARSILCVRSPGP